MGEAGDALRSGEGGEIVIRNQSIPGSSYSAVMRALFLNPKAGGQNFGKGHSSCTCMRIHVGH